MSSNIYRIKNHVNSKFYIGKTSKTIEQRFHRHLYNSKVGGNTHLYKAIRKYGAENFSIELIEQTNNPNERELYWINHLKPHYNMTKGGDGGDTSNSPNYKKAMKEVHSKRSPSDYATYGMLGKSSPMKHKRNWKNSSPVMCEGVRYPSIRDAQDAYPGCNLRKRLDNHRYPEFYRLAEKRKNYSKVESASIAT